MKTLQEHLIDALRSTRLYEMSEYQKDCENTVKSECRNILENLTLINYFRISELYTTNINHWKEELSASIRNAWMFNMWKDRSEGRRERIVRRAFNEKDMYEYDDVMDHVEYKIRKEGETQYPQHPQSVEWLDEAIQRTISQIDTVKTIIVKKDRVSLNDLISKL